MTRKSRISKSRSTSKSKNISKSKTRKNISNIQTNRVSNFKYPTGGKTHVKTKIKRHINPTGKSISVTNSYMNKKGIIRHTRTKEIHPYVAAI
jgi:DNA topoisomerase IB